MIKVVEVPPGPPVIASLLAEIYGPTPELRRAEAERVKAVFKSIPFIVDVDDSYGLPPPQLQLTVNQDELEYFGVQQSDVNATIKDLFVGQGIGYSYRGADRPPIEIAIGLPKSGLAWNEAIASTPVPANVLPGERNVVELGQVVSAEEIQGSPAIYRRDGHFTDMVTGELAGKFEAPIYGMFAVDDAIAKANWGDCQNLKSASSASRPTKQNPRCYGMANGRSLMSPSAIWGWLLVSPYWASMFSWWRSSAHSSCRWSCWCLFR